VPTYQYRCGRCSEQFDLWQSFSEDTLTTCPKSGGPEACTAPGEGEVRKVFASVGITFKGDGFYKNDYGSNSAGMKKEKTAAASKTNGSSNGSDSGTKSSKESGSSTKPAGSSSDSGTSSSSKKSSGSSTSAD